MLRFIRQFSSKKSQLPLSGIKIIDLTRVLAGPYCTQILGDLGADVIKIEHPERGDDTRAWGPPFTKQGHEAAYFLAVNRNKRSVGLNFQHARGQQVLHKLIADADVLVENFVPGVLSKYKLDYDYVRKLNPNIIYTSITGYGQFGPYSQRAGYDVMVEAEFGLMHITGEPNGSPTKVGVAMTDLTTGLYAANSIMASLIGRSRGNGGQHLDVALSDCQTVSLANIASSVLISGEPDSGRHGTAHPSICPYQAFETSDGSIMIGGGNDNLFRLMCDAIGKPDWKTDPRYVTNALRVQHRTELVSAIRDVTQTKSTNEWLEIFKDKRFPYAPINDVKTTLELEHTTARNMIVEVEHPTCGKIKLVNSPVKYSTASTEIRLPPPTLGQHTQEILKNIGISASEQNNLRKEKVISG